MGGSSSKVTVGYKYNVGMHMALCHGPIDAVTAIHVDGRLAWSGVSNGGQITIDAPELFGGEKKEGGVSGLVDLDFGKNDQTANAYLVTQLGSDTPGFRGVMSAVLNQTYVGNNPYLKPWAFEMSRIHVREDGATQWYDSKSAIGGRDGCPEFDVYSCSAYQDKALELATDYFPMDDPTYSATSPEDGIYRSLKGASDLKFQPNISGVTWSDSSLIGDHIVTDEINLCGPTTIMRRNNNGLEGQPTGFYTDPPSFSLLPEVSFCTVLITPSPGTVFSAFPRASYSDGFVFLRFQVSIGASSVSVHMGTGTFPGVRTTTFDLPENYFADGKAHFLGVWAQMDLWLADDTQSRGVERRWYIQVDDFIFTGDDRQTEATNGAGGLTLGAWGTPISPGDLTYMERNTSSVWYGLSFTDTANFPALYEAFQQNFSSFTGGCPCTDMNPAHIIREALTESWGLGHPDADIDDTAFTAAADTLFSEGMGMSILWDKEIPIDDFIAQILQHINAELYVSRVTGKFVLKLIRDDYDVGTLITLDQTNCQMAEDASRPALGELVTSVTVNFTDSAAEEEPGSVTVHNEALLQMQGADRNATVDYVGFMSRSLAKRVALRDLKALSTPLLNCEVTAHRVAAALNIGDVFVLDFPEQGIPETVMRVQSIAVGDGLDNSVAIQCIEDVFSSPPATVAVDDGPSWSDPLTVTPLPAVPRAVIETPYYELVQSEGQLTVDTILADEPDAAFLAVTAGRQGGELNANLLVDSGAGIVDSGTLDFAPYATLSADAWYSDAKLYYTGGKDLDLIAAGDLAQIGDEIVRFDSLGSDVDGSFMNVGRGVLDTVPAEHLTGASILFFDIASDSVQYTASDSIDVTLRTALGSNFSSGEPVDTVVMDSRAIRPYPPGDLKIDAASYPTDGVYSDTNVLTWAHRDRLQQTSGTVFDYTAASIGPEAGTTYTVTADAVLPDNSLTADWLSEDVGGVTSYAHNEINGTPPPGAVAVRYKVTAVRGTYASYQPAMVVVQMSDGPAWTPENIVTALWLDASDATTITDAGGGAVSVLADKSGNARNFEQAIEASRPTTGVDTINGLNVISFDADYLRATNAAAEWAFLHDSTKSAAFVVMSPGLIADPNDLYGVLGTNGGTVNSKGWYLRYDDRSASSLADSIVHLVLNGTGGGGINTSHAVQNNALAMTPVMIGIIGDPAAAAADRSVQYFNGNLIADTALSTLTATVATGAPTYTLDLGSAGNAVFPFKGKIAEAIIISGSVDDPTRQLIEGYLAHKWGLQASLPVDHPYKDAAP